MDWNLIFQFTRGIHYGEERVVGKGAEGEEVFSGKRDEVPAGFHVLCGDTGDGKSAAQSQIHRKVSGGRGGALPSGGDHIRHPGCAALLLVNELRKMFGTVLAENCFVPENVASLRRMGDLSFFIAAMSAVRCVVYLTIAMLVIILVFIIAGMFSKVLAMVFEEAVRYKEENDLTI